MSNQSIAQNKLFIALGQLDVYTLNRLKKYLESPYFNRNETLINYYNLLEPSLKDRSISPPEKEAIWKALIDREYDDTKFRKLNTDLLKLVQAFLGQEVYEQNPLVQADFLLQAVNDKKLEVLFNGSIRAAKKLSEKQFLKPSSFYYHQYEFEKNIYNITEFEIQRSEISNIEHIIENLDKFYIAEKLRYYCTILSRKHLIKHDYQVLFIDHIIRHVEALDYEHIVPINFYYQIFLIQSEPEKVTHYEKLKSLIHLHIEEIPDLEREEIIGSALNYCIKRINEGDAHFLRELFDLYNEFLVKDLLLVDEKITPWKFRNVIVTGLRLGEYAWVEDFINNYSGQLEEKYRNNAVSFNRANLYFYKKEYDKVLELLREVEYEDISYNLNAKSILIATYYELDEYDALYSFLESFRIYLHRNKKFTETKISHYLNLINFTRRLIRVNPNSPSEVNKLRSTIEKTPGVVNKSWLLEKLDELT